ncbi:putative metalloprotease with PDZ domain [Herbaspirillum sp. Sphag1AN]|uniref:M61 family metallopeptidase n=1 Tax=unclassified Herbaspirillum TaxID=2624150 RepID=UPI00161BF9C7|nr:MULTISPECIES: M61 family metallopeptidase [unclassified Herbaspirillum]MBB3214637.1 putative metalloprotease with PDZ domain [Herbaspirillum sp. Sphag1AN]MBB3247833.1 putative metalloprotease with PDZ domain [Herbaspirillum sp. Sphag64]
MSTPIRYSITSNDCAAHLFDVTLSVDVPAAEGQIFALPAWIPGSYMIREFARNIVKIRAESNGKKVALKKRDKHTWQAAPCAGALTLHYQVYAWDLSVRAAHLDQTHAFFNGTSVFLRVAGQEQSPHVVDIQRPPGEQYKRWRVATALPELKAKRYGFGSYIAGDYDELIDHPVELGEFSLASFNAHGVPHDIVITGNVPNLDLPRLSADLKKICEAQIAFFEPKSKRAPMSRYVFMTLAVGDGYGGLEHRASTALICARADLPVKGKSEITDGYRTYLGLCSHEYFHTWNVKRIKPAAFAPYDLNQEGYTSLLWLFEGFTSYYDDLFLVRSGVIDQTSYLSLLSKTINGVLRGSGRRKQSVAESSFDAWVKYYRQDENAPNAIVSYYTKGSLVALGLDLLIRTETRGRKSLDDVMLALWQRYGRKFYTRDGGLGVAEADVEALFEEVSGVALKRFFDRYIRGTDDLPLEDMLAPFAVQYTDQRKQQLPGLGIRVTRGAGGDHAKVVNLYEGGAGHQAGLSAGDLLVALDGIRIPSSGIEGLLARYREGDVVALHVFRRDELLQIKLKLKSDDAPQIKLEAVAKPVAALRKQQAWLGG